MSLRETADIVHSQVKKKDKKLKSAETQKKHCPNPLSLSHTTAGPENRYGVIGQNTGLAFSQS